MTSCDRLHAFYNAAGLPFAMLIDRQEYLPQLRRAAGAGSGTDAAVVESSADCPRNEMIFKHLAPSCYLRGPLSVLLEQSAASSQALDELPAEDMHRAVLNISEVCAEICETAKAHRRKFASRMGSWQKSPSQKADGMSAGG